MKSIVWALILSAVLAGQLSAQAPVREQRFPVTPRALTRVQMISNSSQRGSTVGMAAAGLGAGVVGFIVGGYIGARIAEDPNNTGNDLDNLSGGIAGGTIGESLLLPLGVHLANHRRGRVLPAMLASLGIGVAGVSLAIATQDAAPVPGVVLVLTPVAQVISSIAIERRAVR